MTRRNTIVVASLSVVVFLGIQSSAHANIDRQPTGRSPHANSGNGSAPPSGTTGTQAPGTTEEDAINRGPATDPRDGSDYVGPCNLYATSQYFGEDCPSSSTTSSLTWRQVLDGQTFPRCKVSPLPAGMLPPLAPRGQAGTWMLHLCHDNVTVDGVTPGKSLERRAELVFYPEHSRIPLLTSAQESVFSSLASSYPTPVVVFGPVHPPRVGVTTTFWLAAPRGTATRDTITTASGEELNTLVTTRTGENGTLLRAYVTRTLLFPGVSPDEAAVPCAGAGVPQPASVRPAAGSACSYTYTRSSARLADAKYNLTVEAVWTVEYQDAAGTWTSLNSAAPVTTLFRTPVHEIQTVVTNPG